MKIYAALAEAFRRETSAPCFALLGDANMHWAGALADMGARFIYTRHEHAAVAGATAFARATGQVGVATVTCGPGLTQVMTILPIAVRARIPLVIFAGEAPLHKAWYNQGIDQAPFAAACGAGFIALHDPAEMVEGVHAAFVQAKKERRPVVLSVPFDLQQQLLDSRTLPAVSDERFVPHAPLEPASDVIQKAAKWITDARRPIVLAGLGAVGAKDACVTLAETTGALLATTLPAKGLFHDQPFNLGLAGGYSGQAARAIFEQSDLVIAIGARLSSHTFDGGKLTPKARVIHLDTDPQETVQGRKAADLLITSDARLGAAALTKALSPQTAWRTPAMQRDTVKALTLPDTGDTPDGALHPMAVVKALADIIPPDAHVINTSGHCAYFTAQMNHHPQSHYTVIREFGAIGNGTSFALGLAAAYPERPIVLLDGDGSALMHIQELETMQRHGMKILTIVLNDGAYGSEIHKLRADGVKDEGAVFGRSDFAAIGRGFGLTGKRFTTLEPLHDSMNDFLTGQTPAIWDIHISDQIASPQILRAHRAH